MAGRRIRQRRSFAEPIRPAAAILLSLFAVACAGAGDPSGFSVEYRGAIELDAAGDAGGLVGLSGITWLGGDEYAAVLDNSRAAVRLRLSLAADGSPAAASVIEMVSLGERHDYEDVTPRPEGGIFVCEEDTPAIRAYSLADGAALGVVPLPRQFRPCRPNRGLEALALEPDGQALWTATEEALPADGPAAAAGRGTVVRLARLPLAAGRRAQFAYEVDPPHRAATWAADALGGPLSGVVALVALGDGRLLVLERSALVGVPPFESRLYLVDTSAARDVSEIDGGLAERREALLAKTRVWSAALGLNLEGLCLGPQLSPRSRSLVGVADNGGLGTPAVVTTLELAVAAGP